MKKEWNIKFCIDYIDFYKFSVTVEEFFEEEKPDYVFHAAGKVGGIVANAQAPADFMYENLLMGMHVIHAAWKSGCRKLEFLGSSYEPVWTE